MSPVHKNITAFLFAVCLFCSLESVADVVPITGRAYSDFSDVDGGIMVNIPELGSFRTGPYPLSLAYGYIDPLSDGTYDVSAGVTGGFLDPNEIVLSSNECLLQSQPVACFFVGYGTFTWHCTLGSLSDPGPCSFIFDFSFADSRILDLDITDGYFSGRSFYFSGVADLADAVPEPASMVFLLSGLCALPICSRKR